MTAAPPFSQPDFPDYGLLDSGDGEKLERFGPVVLRRPDPQALWRPRLEARSWARADLSFERESDRGGRWICAPDAHALARGKEPEWECRFGDTVLLVRPTPFKHVGLFPEQAANWDLLRRSRFVLGEQPRLLNLFGYTGAASLVALREGFAVTHVDASKLSIAWARENLAASGLAPDALRVLCDDALAFARREVRRGNRYEAVFLDPPHYGRGPKGEKWQFEEGIVPLLEAVRDLVAERAVVVLSTYAIGFTPIGLANLMGSLGAGDVEVAELALREEGEAGRLLPAGLCARWMRDVELS